MYTANFPGNNGPNYTNSLNPTTVIIQPDRMLTSIAPTLYGRFIPKNPVFRFVMDQYNFPGDSKNRRDAIYTPVPIACPSNENIYVTRFSGPQDVLTVLLIGNEEIPDVRMHGPKIKTVEFSGHLSFTTPVFRVLKQLPLVKNVKFLIGRNQLPVFREIIDIESNDIPYTATPICANVESLQILMDLSCYYEEPPNCSSACGNSCWDTIRSTLESLIESIFNRAKTSFPNLKHLHTELPDSDIYNGCIANLMESSKFLISSTGLPLADGRIYYHSFMSGGTGPVDSELQALRSRIRRSMVLTSEAGHPSADDEDSKSTDTSCSSLSSSSS